MHCTHFKIKSLNIRIALSLITLIPLSSFAGLTVVAGASAPANRAPANKAPTVRHTGVITGQVVTLKGKPVRDANVLLFGPHPGPRPPEIAKSEFIFSVRADSRGRFRATKLPPGKWWLKCAAKGYFELHNGPSGPMGEPPSLPTAAVVGTDNTTASTAAESIQPVVLVMHPQSVLWGQVLDSEGRPVTNQNVWLIWGPNGHGGDSYDSMPVDAQGFYQKEFNDYPSIMTFPSFPIEVKEEVQAEVKEDERPEEQSEKRLGMFAPGHPGYGPMHQFVLPSGKRTRQDFQLVRGATVSGTVYASDGKTPVAGATISGSRVPLANGHRDSAVFPFEARVSPLDKPKKQVV
ncbi:MAG: carboxypeptidase-like regulatory domain-containing protein, partial [Armatimonadota bacterium]